MNRRARIAVAVIVVLCPLTWLPSPSAKRPFEKRWMSQASIASTMGAAERRS